MCTWCDPNEYKKAEYTINGVKYGISIEGNEIVVYRYSERLGGHADMALEFPINYCSICGEMILEDNNEE